MADEDLGPRGQAAVVGGEDDVERVDRAARVLRPVGDGRLDDLLEHDQIAPVAERTRRFGVAATGRPEDDEVRPASSRCVGAASTDAFARAADALRRHLAVEERDAEDVADRLGAGGRRWRATRRSTRARRSGRASRRPGRRSRRRRRLRAGPGAVASAATETGWPGTRIERPCAAGGDDRGLRGRAGAGRRSSERPGDQEQCEQPRVHAAPLSGSGETMRRSS